MQILHGVEGTDGSYKYQGNLEGKELDFVIEIGLNVLLAKGALPFLSADKQGNIAEGSDNLQ